MVACAPAPVMQVTPVVPDSDSDSDSSVRGCLWLQGRMSLCCACLALAPQATVWRQHCGQLPVCLVVLPHPPQEGTMTACSAVQVTGIFGSSMEVYICVDGESPGSSPSAGGPQKNGSNHGVEAAPGVFHCGSAFATVSLVAAFLFCCPCHQQVLPAAARALRQEGGNIRLAMVDPQVVSAAGPWPPVAVPVPFRLEPSTEEERLRCKVRALNSICCATLIDMPDAAAHCAAAGLLANAASSTAGMRECICCVGSAGRGTAACGPAADAPVAAGKDLPAAVAGRLPAPDCCRQCAQFTHARRMTALKLRRSCAL